MPYTANLPSVVVFGATGLLGQSLIPQLKGAGYIVHAPSRQRTNITKIETLWSYIGPDFTLRYGIPIFINLAAYSDVDGCEDDPDQAMLVNALGAHNIALVAQQAGAILVHLSTNYIFDGRLQPRPYYEYDPTGIPVNHYGYSKFVGEQLVRQTCARHFILRTAALFGPGGHADFVDKVLATTQPLLLPMFHDTSPTYTVDLSKQILLLLTQGSSYPGTYHVVGRGQVTWYQFAETILKEAGKTNVLLEAGTTSDRPARRPMYGALDNHLLRLRGLDIMRPWYEALKEYLYVRQA